MDIKAICHLQHGFFSFGFWKSSIEIESQTFYIAFSIIFKNFSIQHHLNRKHGYELHSCDDLRSTLYIDNLSSQQYRAFAQPHQQDQVRLISSDTSFHFKSPCICRLKRQQQACLMVAIVKELLLIIIDQCVIEKGREGCLLDCDIQCRPLVLSYRP